ncbi:MAG: GrpB family protein [Geitlerinemataceae cyanobacterium]
MRPIIVVDYDPNWPTIFQQLHARLWPVIRDVALAIEHVGSTSVPGLAAKPIVDLSAIVPSEREIPIAIEQLSALGYVHRGNLGIAGREAFKTPDGLPDHHLYVCPQGSPALANHLAVRDYLRAHPQAVREYGNLKKQLARQFPNDIDRYIDGKTDLIVDILRKQGMALEQLAIVERANRMS